MENAGIQATKHNDYKRLGHRYTDAPCFQCNCIELQLHSSIIPHPHRYHSNRNSALFVKCHERPRKQEKYIANVTIRHSNYVTQLVTI